ncbi:sensor histidine kinase [Vibrio rhodolitus]|uniref:sensor histidine kinase n=1 Tax=Vibrio rhodolitus TaxID=2231649 RepID=UPI000E0B831A|nr:HAMP domain-containing sensor histidine kinase [Vibrio rhodolitus]
MKIESSIKVYSTCIASIICITFVVFFYNYSNYSLLQGGRLVVKAVMFEIAELSNPKPGHPVVDLPYVVASDWTDLPIIFQLKFSEEDLISNELSIKSDSKYMSGMEPQKTVFFLIKKNADNEVKYISLIIKNSEYDKLSDTLEVNYFPEFKLTIISIISFSFLTLLLLFFLFRLISKPVTSLRVWASSIDSSDDLTTLPDFKFKELNDLAIIMSKSIISERNALESEHDFVKYSSHELRTPISIIRSNSDLVKKMIERNYSKDNILRCVDRIDVNSKHMTLICDSLLHLNKNELIRENEIVTLISCLIETVVNEQRFILVGKTVTVEIYTDKFECLIDRELFKIVISNLIRNAFQHTQEGKVIIKQKKNTLLVINKNGGVNFGDSSSGYGLGLVIVDKICLKKNWLMEEKSLPNGRVVRVVF